MTLIVPNARELVILTDFLTPDLTLKLYSNDRTPAGGDVAADYTEISGGGYTNKPLTFANWGITAGAPTVGLYNAVQEWIFTGATDAPGTIYGYYITRDSDGVLMWAERFPSGSVPFTPVNGSIIRVLPRIEVESA